MFLILVLEASIMIHLVLDLKGDASRNPTLLVRSRRFDSLKGANFNFPKTLKLYASRASTKW